MNYSKIYNDLVAKAKVRGLDKSKVKFYTEAHHIVPVCIGGTNEASNFVLFSGREHFIAHMLLWKAYPDNVSLMRAAHIMSSRWTNDIAGNSHAGINSKVYSKLREEYSQAVSEQVSGENNPFFGKKHSTKVLERISKTKKISSRKRSLINWKSNNAKYMSQYKTKTVDLLPFLLNGKDEIKNVSTRLNEVTIPRWYCAEVYKDFWERSLKPGPRLFSTYLKDVADIYIEDHQLRTMVYRFISGWEPSEDSSYIAFALQNKAFEKDLENLKIKLLKTYAEICQDCFQDWLINRELNRSFIKEAIAELGIKMNPISTGASILSLEDIAEACILWRTGKIQQKTISELLGTARNTISNVVENENRWIEVKSKIEEIEVSVFDKRSRARQQTTSDVLVHA